jgi:hypothetical protein
MREERLCGACLSLEPFMTPLREGTVAGQMAVSDGTYDIIDFSSNDGRAVEGDFHQKGGDSRVTRGRVSQ